MLPAEDLQAGTVQGSGKASFWIASVEDVTCLAEVVCGIVVTQVTGEGVLKGQGQ
jgi:hypothetical protein